MARSLTERLEELAHQLLGPLVLGGKITLVAPFGPQIGLALGVGRRIVDDPLRSAIDVARVRRARLFAAVDTLPDISPAEWALAAALNDLLQTTNHELSGPLTRGRHATLLAATSRLLAAIPPPRTTLELLVRHATFARLNELIRTDTSVRGWIGQAFFRGTEPSDRYGKWPGLRGLAIEPRRVALGNMPEGLDDVPHDTYLTLLAQLYEKSPLTDLSNVARDLPPFCWTLPSLATVGYPVGRRLALRALARAPSQSAVAALRIACERLPAGTPARTLADAFAQEHLERVSGNVETRPSAIARRPAARRS